MSRNGSGSPAGLRQHAAGPLEHDPLDASSEAPGTAGSWRAEALGERVRRQKVVAELGLLALAGIEVPTLMDEVATRVAETLSVEYAEVLELLPSGDRLLLVSGAGWQEGVVGKAIMGTNLESHAGYALISKGPVIIRDLGSEIRFDGPPLLHEHGVVSGLSIAIYSQGRIFGVLGAHTTEPRGFTEDEACFLRDVSSVLGTAIERKLAEERTRLIVGKWKEQAEAVERRFRFLAGANALLSASPDYETTLANAARLAVPALADWCFIDVVEDEGAIHRAAIAHACPGEVAKKLVSELRYPLNPHASHGTPEVLRTGRPEVISEIDDSLLAEIARDAEHLRVLRRLKPGAYMCVPLQVRRRLVGSMGFVSAESGRRYGKDDQTLAESLARCTALAIDGALHHLREVEVARELIQLAKQNQRVISSPTPEDAPVLTPRQLEVLRLMAAGHSAKEIGRKLYRSEATVRNHIRSLLRALGAHSQLEALAQARRMGIEV